MENLRAIIWELQASQQMAVADIKATRASYKRAEAKLDTAIRASQESKVSIQEQIMAMLSHLLSTITRYTSVTSKKQGRSSKRRWQKSKPWSGHEAARMQQPVTVELHCPLAHGHQEPSTAGWNDSSVSRVGGLAILGTANSDTPSNTPQKKIDRDRKKQKVIGEPWFPGLILKMVLNWDFYWNK
jgi:hypothetical protein